jgi:phage baseplate assembly protein W
MAITRSLPTEDKAFTGASIVSSRDRLYKDIDLSLETKEGAYGSTTTGDVYKKVDIAAVKQAVKNLLLTNHYEKPFKPLYGGNLNSLMFENLTHLTSTDIQRAISFSIRNYEPRVEILEVITAVALDSPTKKRVFRGLLPVSVTDDHQIHVEVVFRIKSTSDTFTFNTTLNRLR